MTLCLLEVYKTHLIILGHGEQCITCFARIDKEMNKEMRCVENLGTERTHVLCHYGCMAAAITVDMKTQSKYVRM